MAERSNLPLPDDLAASLQRVVNGKRAETLYDTHGNPVALLLPVVEPRAPTAREQFVQQLRAWRQGDQEEQCREWEQLEEALKEERLTEPRP